ncbi:MAG: ATP-binding protein, partial [Natronomonas sp.]
REFKADQSRLQQVLQNLFINAMQHAEGEVTISVGTIEDGIYVEDTGPGIPESERDEVFESGYTTKRNNTGLGLNIVRRIIDSHGWDIKLEEGSSGGARFEITGITFEPQVHN